MINFIKNPGISDSRLTFIHPGNVLGIFLGRGEFKIVVKVCTTTKLSSLNFFSSPSAGENNNCLRMKRNECWFSGSVDP